MIINFSVVSVGFFFLIFLVFLRHAKISGEHKKEKAFNDIAYLTPTPKRLTIKQLQQKLIDLERQRELVSKDFNYMNTAKQKRALARVLKLNEKIEKIKEVLNES